MCLYVALDEAPRYAEAGPGPSFMCGENVGFPFAQRHARGGASLGAAARRSSRAWCQCTLPKACLTSRLTNVAPGRHSVAARSSAISFSAPAGRPAPYWCGPTATSICALAAVATIPKANLTRASVHIMGRTVRCSGVFQKGLARAPDQMSAAQSGMSPWAQTVAQARRACGPPGCA